MSVNPFEPPRADHLDRAPAAQAELREVTDEALRELVGSAVWVRWTVRLAAVGMVLSVLHAIVALPRAQSGPERTTLIFSLATGLPIGLLYLLFFRRYAGQTEAIARGEQEAVNRVISEQRGFFKLNGVLVMVVAALVVLAIALGLIAAVAARR
jgi:hypothetical protein